MAVSSEELFTDETCEELGRLAEAILPIQNWIDSKEKPPGPTPWRDSGERLNPTRLGAIEVLKELVRTTVDDATLRSRLQAIEHAPLTHFPFPDPNSWRSQRGLNGTAHCRIFESENFLFDDHEQPIVRSEFYSDNLPLFREVVRRRAPVTFDDWSAIANELLKEACPEWPSGGPHRSTSFVVQFAIDILHGIMNMQNDVDEPTRRAVLIELGEHRVVGKEWTRQESAAAVQQFISVLESGVEPPTPEKIVVIPPIGTPPSFKTYG